MNPMFYFLLAITTVLAATANAGPVLDVNGNVIFGGSYYVLPFFFGPAGGALTLVTPPPGGKQCPLFIGQQSSEVDKGTPVRFSNWMSKVGFVPESENLNIEMDVAATICVQSTYWWVTPSDLPIMSFFVAAGPKPKPGEESSRSFFQIKKYGHFPSAYKFAFCADDGCTDVGIATDEYGVRRLALGSEPFPFVFVKAETETSSKTI